jgi:hypothetical protein
MLFRIERSATFVHIDKALQQKISRYDALFTAVMRKSILRATLSHFRYFMGGWEIFHNSVNFEPIFEIFSPHSSEIKDLQLLCRSQRVTAENFEIGCFVYGIRHMACDQYRIFGFPIFVFNFTLTLILWSHFLTSLHVPLAKLFFATNRI